MRRGRGAEASPRPRTSARGRTFLEAALRGGLAADRGFDLGWLTVLSKQLAVYRVGAAVASALPGEVASGAAQGLGSLLGRLPDYDGRRAVVASHMARVLGRRWGDQRRRRIVAEVYSNYSRYWAESLRLASVPQAQVAAGVSVAGRRSPRGRLQRLAAG